MNVCCDIAGARGRFVTVADLDALLAAFPNVFVHEIDTGQGFQRSLMGFTAVPLTAAQATDLAAHGISEITPTFVPA